MTAEEKEATWKGIASRTFDMPVRKPSWFRLYNRGLDSSLLPGRPSLRRKKYAWRVFLGVIILSGILTIVMYQALLGDAAYPVKNNLLREVEDLFATV